MSNDPEDFKKPLKLWVDPNVPPPGNDDETWNKPWAWAKTFDEARACLSSWRLNGVTVSLSRSVTADDPLVAWLRVNTPTDFHIEFH